MLTSSALCCSNYAVKYMPQRHKVSLLSPRLRSYSNVQSRSIARAYNRFAERKDMDNTRFPSERPVLRSAASLATCLTACDHQNSEHSASIANTPTMELNGTISSVGKWSPFCGEVYYNPRLRPENYRHSELSWNSATRLRQLLARPGIIVSPNLGISCTYLTFVYLLGRSGCM